MADKIVKVHIGAKRPPVVVDCAQYDEDWQFHFQVFYNDQRWTIPAGSIAFLVGKKPDGHVFAFLGTLTNNEVVVDCDVQMTACAGMVSCEVRILTPSAKSLATPHLFLDVAASPEGRDDVVSNTSITAYAEVLQQLETGVVIDYQRYLSDLQEAFESYDTQMQATVTQAQGAAADAEQAKQYAQAYTGAPRVAATAAGMTDHALIYVYTGSETGYTNGHWYYWNGSSWADGGVYNSTAFETDDTLSIAGKAADAAACGFLKSSIGNIGASYISTDYVQLPWKKDAESGIRADDGAEASSSAFAHTNYVVVSPYKTLRYMRVATTSSNISVGLAFYDVNYTYISGVLGLSGQTDNNPVQAETYVPYNAVYARFTYRKDTVTYGNFSVEGVSEINYSIDLNALTQFKMPLAYSFGTLVARGYLQPTGANGTSDNYHTRTDFLPYSKDMLVYLDSSDYEWCVWCYGSTSVNSKVESFTDSYVPAKRPVIIRNTGSYLRFGFKRIDGAVLTTDITDETSDYYKISNSLKAYTITDDTVLKAYDFVGGTLASDQTPNTVTAFNPSTLSITDLPPAVATLNYVVWLYTYKYSNRISQLLVASDRSVMYFRKWTSGSSVGSWVLYASQYDIYPTGDNTNRTAEITNILNSKSVCRLAPGEYYITSLALTANKTLTGAGKDVTKLISTASGSYPYAILLNGYAELSDFTLEYSREGEYTPPEDYSLGIHGIAIGDYALADEDVKTYSYKCGIHDMIIRNFSGCGIFMRHLGLKGTSFINNIHIEFCSVGVYLGEWAEYNVISSCSINRCYTGMIVIGANNTVSDCLIYEIETGIKLIGKDAYSPSIPGNHAHGIISTCRIGHTGFYTNDDNGIAFESVSQTSAELVTGCMFTGGINIKNRLMGLQFSSCHFRKGEAFTVDNAVVSTLACVYEYPNNASVLNGGKIIRTACVDYYGNILSDVA